MKWHGVSLYSNNNFNFTIPKIYTNDQWKQCKCYIFTEGQWRLVGAACTNMLWLEDANGNLVYQNGNPYLVREPWTINLLDTNNNQLTDSSDSILIF